MEGAHQRPKNQIPERSTGETEAERQDHHKPPTSHKREMEKEREGTGDESKPRQPKSEKGKN